MTRDKIGARSLLISIISRGVLSYTGNMKKENLPLFILRMNRNVNITLLQLDEFELNLNAESGINKWRNKEI